MIPFSKKEIKNYKYLVVITNNKIYAIRKIIEIKNNILISQEIYLYSNLIEQYNTKTEIKQDINNILTSRYWKYYLSNESVDEIYILWNL
jgi:hypothetical protein